MTFLEALALLGFFVPCFAAASSGAYFKPDLWYEALAKPRWNPPNWVFPPAWAVLYVTIAVSAWLVWREAGFGAAGGALLIWLVSLGLNAAWSWLFFGLRRMDLAFGEVILLWLSIVATMLTFAPHHAGAAWLLLPYLCWVTFAGVLNFTVWSLNRKRVLAQG